MATADQPKGVRRLPATITANHVKLEEIQAKAKAHTENAGLAKVALICITVAGCIAILIFGGQGYLSGDSKTIDAIARLIDKFQIGTIVHALVTLVLGAAAVFENRGKKRAIKKLAQMRKRIESNDPHHEGSGLEEDGSTPPNK